ncbi:MAG TPA: hypothetical protein VIT68_04955 [Candidatus Gracilibacteria bacterium]
MKKIEYRLGKTPIKVVAGGSDRLDASSLSHYRDAILKELTERLRSDRRHNLEEAVRTVTERVDTLIENLEETGQTVKSNSFLLSLFTELPLAQTSPAA